MPNAKAIQNRISSIQDTMKITNAMYMISSSKMQKARKTLEEALPFFEEQQMAVAKMVETLDDLTSRFFGKEEIPEEEKKRGFFVVTADKGMAGAYTHNVLKLAEEAMAESENNRLFVMGELGRQYFTQRGIPIEENFHYTVDSPTLHRARQIQEYLVDLYLQDELDEIYIIYTYMKNSYSMEPRKFCLLPLEKESFLEKNVNHETYHDIVTFTPSLRELLDHMVPSVVSGYIYGALVESFASEQNSRMMSMQNATDNAKQMLHDLGIEYNRVRQAAITQEITEVIAGAKAQKGKKR